MQYSLEPSWYFLLSIFQVWSKYVKYSWFYEGRNDRTNEQTYTVTKHITILLLRSRVKNSYLYVCQFDFFQIFAIPQSRYTCLVKLKKISAFGDLLKCVNESRIWPSEIKSLTNNANLEDRLNRRYRSGKQKFPNLFLMKQDPNYWSILNQFQNFVVTSLNLKNVADLVSGPKSEFIREVISNHMTLREIFLNLF